MNDEKVFDLLSFNVNIKTKPEGNMGWNFIYTLKILCLLFFVALLYVITTSDENSYVCKSYKLCLLSERFSLNFKHRVKEGINKYFVESGLLSTNKPIIQREIEWLNISEGRLYSDYGDNSCGASPWKPYMVTLFKRWTELAEANNITYFIFAGTLLGAWRNEDLIPYDTDMDLLVDREEGVKIEAITSYRNFSGYESTIHLAIQEDWRLPFDNRRRVSCAGKVVPHMMDQCSFQEPLARLIKNNAYVDIYDYFWKNGTIYELSDFEKTYKTSDVFPLKKCRMMGIETYCPNNPKGTFMPFYGEKLHPPKKCINKEWWSVTT